MKEMTMKEFRKALQKALDVSKDIDDDVVILLYPEDSMASPEPLKEFYICKPCEMNSESKGYDKAVGLVCEIFEIGTFRGTFRDEEEEDDEE